MELVYLWVEDYKNIYHQGFNFSHRFECKYDEDKNKLTIDENDDYIPDFFGKNINVTAIVGKNGSGKSSVLEFIVLWINHLFGLNFDSMVMMNKNLVFMFYSKKEKIIIPIWVTSNDISIVNNTHIKITTDILKSIISEKYKEDFQYILKNKTLPKPNEQISVKERINLDVLKQSKIIQVIELLKHDLFTMHYDYSLNKFAFYNDFEGVTSAISLPNKDLNILSDLNYDKSIIIKHLVSNQYIDNNKYFKPKTITIRAKKITNPEAIHIPKQITPLETVKFILNSSILFMIKDKINKNIYISLLNNPRKLTEYIKKNFSKLKEIFHYKGSKQLHTDDMDKALNYYKLLEEKASNKLFEFDNITIQIHINLKEINNDNIEILTEIPYNCFDIEIQDKNFKKYEELSSGEKSALRIRFYIEYLINKKNQNNFFILLDEPANDMHPEWQKNLLNYLIDTFKNREQNIHFIFTTHSPFMISDLAKQNIIFLDTDEQGNCKVVDGLKEKKQTFGANIHTLLSDGFFMEDGLMGEFAKNKINKIIDFHKKVEEENKKEKGNCFSLRRRYIRLKPKFWQIQSIIGEEYLKQVVKNHLRDIENILLGHNQAKKEEIKRLRKEADRLEKM